MLAKQYYTQGELNAAIAEASKIVQKKPTATQQRTFLAELLCIKGELTRADQQWQMLLQQLPEQAMSVTFMRQLIKAEMARIAYFQQGTCPSFIEAPDDGIKKLLQAFIEWREQNIEGALEFIDESYQLTPPCQVKYNEEITTSITDLNHLTATVLEVFTTDGQYYWVPFHKIEHLVISKPSRPIEIIWRPATLTLINTAELQVTLPAIYALTDAANHQALLGESTSWQDSRPQGLSLGQGLKEFLIGEAVMSLNDIHTLSITPATVTV